MNPAASYHRTHGGFSFLSDKNTVCIRLKTGRGEVDRCVLLHGDKFNWAGRSKREMALAGSDQWHDYWQLDVHPKDQRLCYAFEVHSGGHLLWYKEDGWLEELDEGGHPLHYFEFPFLHESEVFQVPAWVQSAVFYQIFPERFHNGDVTNDPQGVEPWDAEPTYYNYLGGDLQGIIQRLNYIDELGFNAVYLTPIFYAPASNHKYATEDYLKVDPSFGDIHELKQLIDDCHSRGIRIMLDGVFNHCSSEFEPFRHVLKHGPDSPYAEWFHFKEWPCSTGEKPGYLTFGQEAHMPKWNTQHPEARRYLFDAVRMWTEMGIDGWRLDVADEVDHAFWREFRSLVKGINPEIYIVGEVWHDAMPWLQGEQFDSVMNYMFRTTALQTIVQGQRGPAALIEQCIRMLMAYPDAVNAALFNLLGSHDTPRILTLCEGDSRKLKQALLLLFTFPGVPCLYYGDEIGMTGSGDPQCRRGMIWDESKQDGDIRSFVISLVKLRKEMTALHGANIAFQPCHQDQTTLVYRRWDEIAETELWIAMNLGKSSTQVSLPIPGGTEVLSGIFHGSRGAGEGAPEAGEDTGTAGAVRVAKAGDLQLDLEPYGVRMITPE